MEDYTPSGSATPTAHRRRLEDALGESPLESMLGTSHRGFAFPIGGTPPPASQKRSSKWTSPEACDEMLGDLMNQLGTAVASSTGSRLTLPSIITPHPKSTAVKKGGGVDAPSSSASAMSSPLLMNMSSGSRHWAESAAVVMQASSSTKEALPAMRAVGGSIAPSERKRRRRKHKNSTSTRSRSSRTDGE
ncbi:Hypothetical protein, putative [Bodo saltans]|uniref:Uncharacterized protein n=1 Tax=Bodo saltans TaxID=75058 RepID=A0A0S4IX50_BODSA|nr:Hypothetical protein, putative [Bodo saltans]|eukprot:CUG36025.1 Hypothetical protein, putative [Bodo saltans]